MKNPISTHRPPPGASADTARAMREFCHLLREASPYGSLARWQAFRDFAHCLYQALSAPRDARPPEHTVLQETLTALSGPTNSRLSASFKSMASLLSASLRAQPYDFLGTIYETLGFTDTRYGAQFFTPWTICELMAAMTMPTDLPSEHVITVAEPSCGSGRMILAVSSAVSRSHPEAATRLWFEAVDKDAVCQHMTFIQLALASIPAIVRHGDSIRNETCDWAITPAGYQLLNAYPDLIRRIQASPS